MLVVHQTIQLKVDHSDITFTSGIYRHGTTDVHCAFRDSSTARRAISGPHLHPPNKT